MADVEKVKNGIKNCIEEKHPCASCEYKKRQGCTGWLLKDAMSVIEQMEQRIKQFMQEQEPLEPVVFGNGKTFEEAATWWYGCPVCKKPVDTTDNFCRKCGRALIWQKDGEQDG